MRHGFAFDVTYALTRAILWPVSRLRVSGREHLTPHRTGGCLVVANHISHFDPWPLAFALGRRLDYMTSAEFFSPRPVGAWIRAGGGFPVNRDGSSVPALRDAVRRLRAGRMVGMFPEGGIRSGATSMLNGAPAAAAMGRLAVLAGVPVLPAVILGTDRLYSGRHWRRPWRRRVPVWISFGPAIAPEEWDAFGAPADLLGERIRALYAWMKQEYKLQPADLPTTLQRRRKGF